jgi:uncharacterized membrane protein
VSSSGSTSDSASGGSTQIAIVAIIIIVIAIVIGAVIYIRKSSSGDASSAPADAATGELLHSLSVNVKDARVHALLTRTCTPRTRTIIYSVRTCKLCTCPSRNGFDLQSLDPPTL